MSLRIDASEWIPGALSIGEAGLGVLGAAIPSMGNNGPAYVYNDLSLPADNAKEICGRIISWPNAGTLFAYEDSSFSFIDAPDGTYSFEYQLYVDGVATGSPTAVTLTIGSLAVSSIVAWSEASDTIKIDAKTAISAAIAWAEANDSVATATSVEAIQLATLSWREENDTALVALSVDALPIALLDWTEMDDTVAITSAASVTYSRAPAGSGYSVAMPKPGRPAQING